MPAKYTPIPVYQQSCLATDANEQSFYLVGSPTVNILEVNFVTNPDATTVNLISSQDDPSIWNYNAPKLCHKSTFSTTANGQVRIVQFGPHSSAMTIATSNYTIFAKSPQEYYFVSPKLFAWSGSINNVEMFSVYAQSLETTSIPFSWFGLRLDFLKAEFDLAE